MNSALKPSVLPTSGANQTTQSQHSNKPMHPQGAPSFGQPSGHINQNPFPNMNAAHNHPNAQQNHFGMGAAAHYNMGTIPPSNHPVASLNPSPTSQQIFGAGAKGIGYTSGFQGTIGHQQNQNSLPPVSQTLPATTNQTPPQAPTNSTAQAPEILKDHPPQVSNGTSEAKPENHVSSQLQTPSVAQEKPKLAPIVQEQKPPPEQEVVKQTPPSQQPEAKLESQTPQPAPVPETTRDVAPVAETKTSSTSELESLPSPAKSTEKAETPKDVGKEPETISTSDESCVSDGKAPCSEDAGDAKEGGSETDAPSESSAEETASDKTKPDIDNANDDDEDNDVEMESSKTTTKGREQSPTKKDASPNKTSTQKTTPIRKQRAAKVVEETKTPKQETKTPAALQKSPSTGKVKRQRVRTQHYQSPLPELEIITKISSTTPRAKANDDKLIYFYKNEFMAVRNAEGGFYLCQAVQNIYKSSSKIKIRWLSQDKSDKTGEIYTPDFYDLTDFDCILTSLDLKRVDKGKYRLSPAEKERTDSILKRCLAVEKGEISTPPISEEHPDGLDLSLYKAEDQLKKNKRGPKRKSRSPAKSPQKAATATKKSPEAAKVRKIETATTTKTPDKKAASARKASTPAKKPAATPTTETKKAAATVPAATTSSSRLSRGKSKGDTTKSSPVVDQKKAKVLAKIGRKSATIAAAAPSRSQPSKTKNAKASSSAKPVTSSLTAKQSKQQPSTAAVSTRPASTRKIKRSGRI